MRVIAKYRDGGMDTFDHVKGVGQQEALFVVVNTGDEVLAMLPIMNVLSLIYPERDVQPSGIVTV